MNSQSIEFNEISQDPATQKIVRKSFRIPVEDNKNIWVVINDEHYTVLDICFGGIGIVLKNNSVFCVDQVLKNCELNIFDTAIKDLNGRVIHFTSQAGKDWQCGIQWINTNRDIADQMSKIVLKMKEQLLEDNRIPFK